MKAMKSSSCCTLLLLGTLAACVATPAAPPEEAAPKIVALLVAGKDEDAAALFASELGEPGARDALYPLLFEQARTRFERGEAHESAAILRLMGHGYPKSIAVRESLVYALFLERAANASAAPELVQELGAVIASLRKDGAEVPQWVDLAQSQQAIDRGDVGAAREAFARFEAHKDTPPELTLYVEDIDRYLKSHP